MEVAEKHQPDRIGPEPRWRALLGPAILFLVIAGFFWRLVLSNQYTWIAGSDLTNQVLPWMQYQAGEWHAGRIPLWDPYQWSGQPLIGQVQPGVAYPLNWLLYALPLRQGWLAQKSLHWYYVLIHFMAALFCYWLCRDLDCSRWASAIAGLVFALCGYVGYIDWPQMLNGAIWAPLVFLFLFRAGRGEKPLLNAAVSGALLGVAWLSGHHQAPTFIAFAAAGVWIWLVFRGGRPNWRMASSVAVFLLFCVLISGLQVLPGIEYGRLATRWVGAPRALGWNDQVPYTVHEKYSLPPHTLFTVVLPVPDENSRPFMGLVAFSLALLAISCGWRHPAVRTLALVGTGGLLFALGNNNPLHGIIYSLVPFAEKARTPAHAIIIFNFAFSALVAFGIDALRREPAEWKRWGYYVSGAASVILLFCLGFTLAGKTAGDGRVLLSGLLAMMFAAVLAGLARGGLSRPAAFTAIATLILIELGNVTAYYFVHRDDAAGMAGLTRLSQNADIVEFLRRQPSPFRIAVDDKEIPYNFGDWHGIEDSGGYLASLTNNQLVNPAFDTRMRNLLNVTFSVGKEPLHPGWREVYKSSTGIRVFFNPDVLPRAWSAHSVVNAKTVDELKSYIRQKDFDLRRNAVLLNQSPAMESCAGEDLVRVTKHQSNLVEISARMKCRGLVLLADTWFPGWQATVDGKPTGIYEAYGVIRAVEVPSGNHLIIMRYRPLSVILGGFMTLAGVAGLLCLAYLHRNRERAVN